MTNKITVIDGPEAEERAREEATASAAKKMNFSRRSKFRMLSPAVKKEKFKAGLDEAMLQINLEYKNKFLEALEKFGAKNIRDLADDKKQEFFNYIDQHNEEVEQIDELSLQTMKSAKDKLSRKAYDAHMDDNKNDARFQATRALKMGDKIKDKVARTVTHGGKTYTLPKDSPLIRKEEVDEQFDATRHTIEKDSPPSKDKVASANKQYADMAAARKKKQPQMHEETEEVNELNRRGVLSRYINKTRDDPARKEGNALALRKKWATTVYTPKVKGVDRWNEEVEQMDEEHSPEHIKQAIGIAADKRYRGGNMTGAIDAIEKVKVGLSGHPQVKAVLKSKNESLELDQEEIVNEGKFSEMDIDNQEAKRRATGKTDAPTDFAKIGASIKKDRENAAKKGMKEDFIFQIKKSVMLGEKVLFEDGETRTLTRVEAHRFLNKYITSNLSEQLDLTETAIKSYDSFLHIINNKSGE